MKKVIVLFQLHLCNFKRAWQNKYHPIHQCLTALELNGWCILSLPYKKTCEKW